MKDEIVKYINERKNELYSNYVRSENSDQHFVAMIAAHRKNELEELLKWIESK